MKSGPHLPQLEKALAQKRKPNTAIKNKKKNKKKKKKTSFPLKSIFDVVDFYLQPTIHASNIWVPTNTVRPQPSLWGVQGSGEDRHVNSSWNVFCYVL